MIDWLLINTKSKKLLKKTKYKMTIFNNLFANKASPKSPNVCLSVPHLPVNWLTDRASVVSMECISLSLSCHGGYSRLLQPKVCQGYKISKKIFPSPLHFFFKWYFSPKYSEIYPLFAVVPPLPSHIYLRFLINHNIFSPTNQ